MFKKYFVTGLVILLPLAVTITVVAFIVNFLTQPFMGIVTNLLQNFHPSCWGFSFCSDEKFIRYGSQFLILLGLFFGTVLLGVLARWFFFHAILKLSDNILHKIPLFNKVYKTTQELIKTLFVTDKNSFKQVVLAPFPAKGIYSVGLVTRSAPKACREALKSEDLLSVFIATTPNPTTGFLMMYKKKDLIFLDIKTEDAIKYIVSCGVIIPEEKHKKRKSPLEAILEK
jgi:uncharacterized membrane protein